MTTYYVSSLLAAVVVCLPTLALAQEPVDPAEASPTNGTVDAAPTTVGPVQTDPEPTTLPPSSAEASASPAGGAAPEPETRRLAQRTAVEGPAPGGSASTLSLAGGMELDFGYAAYTFEVPTDPEESFHDARGRFVFGPVFEHDFGREYFLKGTGQVVAWAREELGKYQINVDDVYVQIGKRRSWDVQAGRFETWPVYHKGLGFDYYTLEDGGALKSPPQNSGLYGVYKYELNFIYRRETPARAAIHWYPTSWLSFELAGAYGKDQLLNAAGGRAAANFRVPFLRVSAGAEYKTYAPAQEASTLDATGMKIVCDRCADRIQYGAAGSAVVNVSVVELGGGIARGLQESYSQKDGTPDLPGSSQRTTFGGYAQVDVGKLLFDRSVVAGAGAHVTEALVDNGDFERHIQGAAYAAYPLGFNEAMLKLVVSNATLLIEEDTGDGMTFTTRSNEMLAARLRFSYAF